jgi:hypothetical protein
MAHTTERDWARAGGIRAHGLRPGAGLALPAGPSRPVASANVTAQPWATFGKGGIWPREGIIVRHGRTTLVVACVAMTALVAGGIAGASESTTVTPSHTIVVTLKDSGHSYALHRGDRLDVRLSGPSYATWSEPASSDQSVLQLKQATSGSTATGRFLAVAGGRAKVTAVPHLICSSVCAGPSLPVFEVTVTVVGAATWATASRTTMVTYADNGHHYRLHKGAHFDVQLSGPSSLTTWSEPSASDNVVLDRRGGSSGMTATATFIARTEGKAQVTAFGTINCSPPCAQPILLFRVNVSVVG